MVEDQGDFEMARDNAEPAYSAPAAPDVPTVEADQTGTRTAETTDQGVVTEAQAEQAAVQDGTTATPDNGAEAAAKQAQEDAQALIDARGEDGLGYVFRDANPEVGGESFPSFAPTKR
jgi:hypothetical protein